MVYSVIVSSEQNENPEGVENKAGALSLLTVYCFVKILLIPFESLSKNSIWMEVFPLFKKKLSVVGATKSDEEKRESVTVPELGRLNLSAVPEMVYDWLAIGLAPVVKTENVFPLKSKAWFVSNSIIISESNGAFEQTTALSLTVILFTLMSWEYNSELVNTRNSEKSVDSLKK